MKKFELFIPWLIVLIATVGSLFFSQVTHREPCTLCWYQRIMMFPLAIILGIAAFRGAYRIVLYVLPLAILGLALSTYHVIMIYYYQKESFCPACTLKSLSHNPITFPFLSLCSFGLLTILLFWVYFRHKHSKKL